MSVYEEIYNKNKKLIDIAIEKLKNVMMIQYILLDIHMM